MIAQEVNLLPWRQRREKQQQHTYFLMLALSVLLPSIAAFLLHWEQSMEVDRLRSEISRYKQAGERSEGIKDKQALLIGRIDEAEAWLVEYEAFVAHRTLFVKLWGELARHLPDSMHYRSLQLEDSSLTLTGMTMSSPDLATYMRRLEASPVFVAPRLIDLEDAPVGHRFGIEAELSRESGPA